MITRRHFVKTTGLGLGAAACTQSLATDLEGKTVKPNIIYVLADQLRYQSCGYAGDHRARTPNLDRLAGEGVNFCQAVSSMPVCSAYRASLMTGKYTTSTGMVINELRMNTDHRCLGHCFTEAGYDTAYIGKWHLYANELGNHLDPKNSFVPPGPDRLGFDGLWAGYNFHHDYYDTYYHTDTPEKISYPSGSYEPDAQTDMAIDYVRRAAGMDDPFFLVLSVGTPHDPWTRDNVPEEYHRMFAETDFPVPPNYSEEWDPYGDGWSNVRLNPELLEKWMRCYYAMTANLDWNVGRLLQAVDEAGIGDNTLIVFTSDHGEMFGGHGRRAKNIFYDEAARVPFLIRWAGHTPEGLVSEACLNTVDIMPTLLGLAGLDIPEAVEGMDLSHLVLGQSGPEPTEALLMNTGACAAWEDGHEWRALRDRQYTYAVQRGGGAADLPRKELLFDNLEDPWQMRNLAGEGSCSDRLERFRCRLDERMTALNDTFPPSTWYRDNWIENRIIQRTATMG